LNVLDDPAIGRSSPLAFSVFPTKLLQPIALANALLITYAPPVNAEVVSSIKALLPKVFTSLHRYSSWSPGVEIYVFPFPVPTFAIVPDQRWQVGCYGR